jgi:LysM repeat protein
MPKYTITLCVILALLVGALPVRAQEAAQPLVHVVQPGENLYRIALSYGLTVDALMAANGLAAPDHIVVGQTLIIPVHWAAAVPAASATRPAASGSRLHVVQPGESLLQIARQYGITLDTLITTNAIANPSLITVGQVLVIPGNSSTAQPVDSSPMELDLPTGPENSADAPLVQGPTLTTPDLGILPVGDAAGKVASTDADEVAAGRMRVRSTNGGRRSATILTRSPRSAIATAKRRFSWRSSIRANTTWVSMPISSR